MKKIRQMLFTLFLLAFSAGAVWAQTPTPERFVFEVTATEANQTFAIPLSGNNGSPNTLYNWNIDWGDGSEVQKATRTNTSGIQPGTSSAGIPHSYATAGTYQITITPVSSTEAWLRAFGFNSYTNGANTDANKQMVTKVISPLTPLMTRTQAQIRSNTAVDYEWSMTFYGCVNLMMGPDFTFAPEWNSITKVGTDFASAMFYNVRGASFTMNEVFNLPQGITTVGGYFAYVMFQGAGTAFRINEVFKFPKLSLQDDVDKKYVFSSTFYLNSNNQQSRTIESIVNGNPVPSSEKYTFGGLFIDRQYAPKNWGGSNGALTMTIPTQPATTEIAYGSEVSSVVASPALPTVTYQWYSNTTNSNSGGEVIEGATSATLNIKPNAGTHYYYYCIVSGTSWGKSHSVTSNVAAVTVNPKELTIANPSVTTTKIYDGNKVATATKGALENVVGDDLVNVEIATATFNSKDVTDANEITVVYSMTGDNGNYIVPADYTIPGTITPLQLTISEPEVEPSKEYDGNKVATATKGALENVVGDDLVNVEIATATFNSKDVSDADEITVAYSMTGDNGNYIVPADYTIPGTITPLQLTIATPSVTTTKTYDGSNVATATKGALKNVVDGDKVEVEIATATFNSKDVSDENLITVVYSMTGDNGNYIVPADYTIPGTITPLQLTVTGVTATNRAYNGVTTVALTGGELEGIIEGDEVTPILGTGTMDNANAGNGKTVTTNIKLSNSNYALQEQPAVTVNIAKAPLTITAENKTATQGDATPAYTATYSGFANGETKDVLAGTLSFASAYTAESEVGTYDITPSGLTSSNYEIAFVKGTLSVAAKLETPIARPQLAANNVIAYAANNAIVLHNLPQNAKVQVYNLNGKQIYSANPGNPKILKIGVQTGVYIVKINNQTLRVTAR